MTQEELERQATAQNLAVLEAKVEREERNLENSRRRLAECQRDYLLTHGWRCIDSDDVWWLPPDWDASGPRSVLPFRREHAIEHEFQRNSS